MCGGTSISTSSRPASKGLSPRVRGNRPSYRPRVRTRRSIPACAGEPAAAAGPWRRERVYPRVCGGTRSDMTHAAGAPGLSPRVRGNRLPRPPARERLGSIPACAGEPQPARTVARGGGGLGSIPACAGEPPTEAVRTVPGKVYPRVCGGTPGARARGWASTGLSPRVRGNRADDPPERGVSGSIPACAGEPSCRGRSSCT